MHIDNECDDSVQIMNMPVRSKECSKDGFLQVLNVLEICEITHTICEITCIRNIQD